MPKRSKPKQLAQELQDWSDKNLAELAGLIQALVESRQHQELEPPPTRLDGSPVGKNGGQGYIEIKTIRDAKTGKVYGPYRYLRYWATDDSGKKTLKSAYLGKETRLDDAHAV